MRSGRGPVTPTLCPNDERAIAALLTVFCEDVLRDTERVARIRNVPASSALVGCMKLNAVPSSHFLSTPMVTQRAKGHYDSMGPNPSTILGALHSVLDEAGGEHARDHVAADDDDMIDDDVVFMESLARAEAEFREWEPVQAEGRILKQAILRAQDYARALDGDEMSI